MKSNAVIASTEDESIKLKRLARCGVSALALSSFWLASPAVAAETAAAQSEAAPSEAAQTDAGGNTDTATDDEIVVTGFRESLQSAQSRKRTSSVIQDSVTAEDIGALPDRSVTETLQRIPGVSINRFAAGIDPDHFSVEGSGVVVRGLTYVRSEFNGREAFSANNGRALSFADVPSELLAGVDVFKSPSADRIEGGIAGVVNLRTRLPFDRKGLVLSGSLENNYGDFIKKSSPVVSVLASNTWETGVGEFGLLASFSYSQLFSRADRFQVSSFRVRQAYSDGTREDVVPFAGATPSREVIFPRGGVVSTQEFDRERYGYSAAAQWRSNDGSMEATFQFLRSDARQAWTEHAMEIATDNVAGNGDSRAVTGTTLTFDDSGLFESGFITGPTGWRADQNTAGNRRTPAMGLQSNNIRRDHVEKLVTSDYAFNFKWDVTERLGLNFDYQHVDSSTDLIDNGLWLSSYQDVFIKLNGNQFPDVQFLPPQNCPTTCSGTPGGSSNYPAYFTGTHQSFTDPFNSFYRSAMDHIEQSDGNADSFRLDGELTFPDSGFLKSIRAGGRYADRKQTARFSTYNWGRLSEQWGNGGPVWLDDPVDGVPGGSGGTAPQGYEPFYYANFFRNSVANPLGGQGRLFYSGNSARDYAAYIAYANAINREWETTSTACADGVVRNGGWNSLADRCGVVAGTPFLPGEINPIREQNTAGYIMATFDTDFANGWNFSGNVGLRYTRTKRVADGFLQIVNNPGSIPSESTCAQPIPPGQQPPPFCTFSAAVRQQARDFLNGALTPNEARLTYDYWLPSVNLKLEVSDDLQFRAAFTKGVAPPETGLIRNFFNVPGLTAAQNVDSTGAAIPGSFTIGTVFNAGNPYLKPVEADSYDLTAEWYFSDVGQLTASLFYKRLKNVLTNDIVRIDITNNGATFPAIVTTPVNSDEIGKIKGLELAYQQTFDFLPGFLKGLGLQANYTYVDSSGVPQSTLSATDPDVAAGRQPTITGDNFPLQGLSKHTVNITPFLDVGPVSLRASYNWRSKYLLTLRDVITPFDPIFQQAYGQLDASVTATVNEHLKLGVQGVNLLNTVTKTSAAVLDQDDEVILVPRGWYMTDRRFTLFARLTF